MKFVLSLLAIGLLAWQSSATVPAFTVNQQYTYDYDTYIVSGIEGNEKQFAGVRSGTKVTIQNLGQYMYMKLGQWSYTEFNKEVHNEDLFTNIPWHTAPSQWAKLGEIASYPIRFTMEGGIVKSYEALPEDPIWSINLKRVILSAFQLNLDRVNSVRHTLNNYLVPEDNPHYYRVMEDGLNGECETVYHVNSLPYYKFPYERVLNVTKHTKLDKCVKRPFYSHFNLIEKKCDSCNTKEPLRSTSTNVYDIRGDRQYLTIEKIRTIGTHVFTPITHGETFVIETNRTMTLEDVSRIREPIRFPEKSVTYKSLAYDFADKLPLVEVTDLEKPNYFPTHPYWDGNFEQYVAKCYEILERLSKDRDVTMDIETEHIPQDILYIIDLLTTMDYKQIEEFYMELKKESVQIKQKELMRRLFVQILPLVGTNPTIKAILTLVEKDLVTPREITSMFSALPLYVKQPSKTLLEYFYDMIVRYEKVESKKHVYASMWLSFGTLLRKSCIPVKAIYHPKTMYNVNEKRPFVSGDVCRKYIKEIYDMFLKSTTVFNQITFVKVLGNMRSVETLPYLKPIVVGEITYPTLVRKYAAVALTKLAKDLPKEVKTFALPMYLNYTEPVLMRIMAFEMVMSTKPKYSFFYDIGSTLKYDPSKQVASYVYSTFVAIANSTDPCFEKMSKDIKTVLTIIPKISTGYDYSHKVMFDYFNDKYGFGGNTVWSWVGSKKSFIPEHFYVKKTSNFLGRKINLLELSVDTKGFYKLYEKIFGLKGLFSTMDKKPTYNMYRNTPRQMYPVDKELTDIDEAIKFKPRTFDDMEAALSLKVLGEDITFTYLDEMFFNSFTSEYYDMPRDLPTYLKTNGLKFDFHKIALDIDSHFEIPTDLGIPLEINIKMPSYMKLTGSVKFDLTRGLTEDRLTTPSNIRIETDLHPLYTARSISTFGFRTAGLRKFAVGQDTQIDIKFPIVTTLDYDMTLKKLNFKYTPAKTPYEMFRLRSHGYTYTGPYHRNDKVILGTTDMKINYFAPEYYHEKEYKYGQEYFGVGFNIKATTPMIYQDMSLWRQLAFFTTKESHSFHPHDYYTFLIQRIFNGFEHMARYYFFNPQHKVFDVKLMFVPYITSPTTEFEFVMDLDFATLRKVFFTEYYRMGMLPSLPYHTKNLEMKMELIGRGRVERKWTGLLNVATTSEIGINRKVSFDFERSPIPEYDPTPLKVCYRSTTKFPTYTEFYSIDHKELRAEMFYDLSFGRDCNEKAINVKVVAEKTSQQKYLMDYPTVRTMRLKEICNEHMQQGYNFSNECWELFVKHYNLRKYIIDVEYENLPPRFVNFTARLSNWFRHTYYDSMDYNGVGVVNPEKRIKIVANFSSYEPLVDVKIYKPQENIFYKRLYYPYVFPTFKVLNTRINYLALYMHRFFNYDLTPICFVQGSKHISTFDRVKYEFPLTKCYQVLFRDCTEEEKFTVLTKTVEHRTYTKVLKVFLGNHKIEILPVGESPTTAPLVVRVDGTRVTVDPSTPFVFPDPKNEKFHLFTVRRFNNWFILKTKVYGFEIRFNGHMIDSRVSPLHRGHLCGLCGEYNGEVRDEFKGPDGCVYHDPTRFGYSYVIPDQTCDIPAYKDRQCVLKPMNTECDYYRNKVIYKPTEDMVGVKSNNVCFSRLPVLHCSRHCKPTNYVKATVGFHCLNAREDKTIELIRRSKTEELSYIRDKSEDYFTEIEYPEACVKL